MSKLGIHFPNAGFRDLDALWSVPWDHFVVLHLNREWVPEIRLRYPQATILVRAYLENWAATEPDGWARSIAQWAEELRPFNIELTFANEQNLAAEGHPMGARPGAEYPPASLYQDILDWDVAVISELRALLPWATIHFPALSQGHSDDRSDAGYIGFEMLRDAVEMCDVLDAHVYWDESTNGQREDIYLGERYRLLHSLFPNKPIYISECGTLPSGPARNDNRVTDWIEALPDYVAGACWFIWDSDLQNQPWILRDIPPRVQALRAYGLSHAVPCPVESMFSPVAIALRLILSTTSFNPTRYTPNGGTTQAIGYGHAIQPDEQIGGLLSEQDASKLLQEDLIKCLQELEQRVNRILTVIQKAALLSLIYELDISLLTPDLVEALNKSDIFGAADIISRSPNANSKNPAASIRRRQMEIALFQRESLRQSLLRSPTIAISSPQTTAPCCIASTAHWISVKQGERFQVVGVWYYPDSAEAVQQVAALGAAMISSEVYVKVEEESGLGIPAELVIRRWNNQSGECEPQFSDAFGAVRFNLGDRSKFNPTEGPGPDRIHIGDCIIAGLGIPIRGGTSTSHMQYVIRIRKTG
jgi:GH24 family phage-related lysozyme (muramidase)